MKTRRLLLAFAACVFASSGAVVLHAAQNVSPAVTAAVNDPARPQADKDRDAMRRPAAMLAASGIKGGDKVIELAPGGGYVTRLLSKLVGPTGKVYAANLPTFNEKMKSGPLNVTGNPTYNNVAIIEMPYSELKAPEPVDVVWTSENYHDFKNMGQFRTDTNAMNRAVFAALKPGGRYIVTDFTTQPGHGPDPDADAAPDRSRDHPHGSARGGVHARAHERRARASGGSQDGATGPELGSGLFHLPQTGLTRDVTRPI